MHFDCAEGGPPSFLLEGLVENGRLAAGLADEEEMESWLLVLLCRLMKVKAGLRIVV